MLGQVRLDCQFVSMELVSDKAVIWNMKDTEGLRRQIRPSYHALTLCAFATKKCSLSNYLKVFASGDETFPRANCYILRRFYSAVSCSCTTARHSLP